MRGVDFGIKFYSTNTEWVRVRIEEMLRDLFRID